MDRPGALRVTSSEVWLHGARGAQKMRGGWHLVNAFLREAGENKNNNNKVLRCFEFGGSCLFSRNDTGIYGYFQVTYVKLAIFYATCAIFSTVLLEFFCICLLINTGDVVVSAVWPS